MTRFRVQYLKLQLFYKQFISTAWHKVSNACIQKKYCFYALDLYIQILSFSLSIIEWNVRDLWPCNINNRIQGLAKTDDWTFRQQVLHQQQANLDLITPTCRSISLKPQHARLRHFNSSRQISTLAKATFRSRAFEQQQAYLSKTL